MKLVIYGNELLFTESLAALFAKRGHEVIACPTCPEELLSVSQSIDFDACLVNAGTSSDPAMIQQISDLIAEVPAVALHAEIDSSSSGIAGVNGICLRADSIEEIERVLELTVTSKHVPGASSILSHGANAVMQRPTFAPHGTLTVKEQAVLELLIPGTPTTEIASEIGISVTTVRTHLQNLFRKFGVHSRIALIAAAINAKGSGAMDQTLALR